MKKRLAVIVAWLRSVAALLCLLLGCLFVALAFLFATRVQRLRAWLILVTTVASVWQGQQQQTAAQAQEKANTVAQVNIIEAALSAGVGGRA